ncbi:MAG: D-2-hydroxyacid dehydrogenase [Luminiphilus sp.]|nr:D-2-hydroxyacid dehydrogenase [Luminiphilus sp.]
MPSPQCLLIARDDDDWTGPVLSDASELLPTAIAHPDASSIDTSAVRVLVGGPPDLAHWVPRCPSLQWIQSTWAGVDALKPYFGTGIKISPLRGVYGQAMSEFTMGWILSIQRNILIRATARQWQPQLESGLNEKTIGIMGTGTIGKSVAAAARTFNMTVKGLNSSGTDVPGFDRCFSSEELLEFAKDVDYLVSILPKTPETDGLISEALIEQLAPESTVINVGRGNAVDERALRSGFDNGKLTAAVLDVFDIEPLPQDHWYWAHDRVFITSHTSAPTPSSAVITVFARNLRLFLAEQPFNTVDATKGY